MSRRAVALAGLMVGSVIVLGPRPATAAGEVVIREADVSDFPTVRLVVSTPDSVSLDRADVAVVENEASVDVTDVYPLGTESGGLDAVLAIDVSNSMRGRSLDTALAAARVFLAGVPPSMPLGVVAFSERPVVLSRVSADREVVERAVASIGDSTSQGTALFDAVATAATMFDAASDAQHNLILVTDGRNTGGTNDLQAAVTAAQRANMHVFTVGLSGPETDEVPLRALAGETGGAYAAISPDELTTVYAGLARDFTRQYVIEYRSKAPLGAPVTVSVELPVGTASIGFLSPGPDALRTRRGTAIEPGFWAQPAGMAVVSGLVFLTVGSVGMVVSNVRERRRRERQLRATLGAQAPVSWEHEADRREGGSLVPRRFADAAERVADTTEAGRRLARRLENAGWAIRSGEFLWLVAAVAAILCLIGMLVANLLGGLVGSLVGILVPFAVLSHAAERRKAVIQAQLADTLMVIASSMRAGHSFMQSLDSAAKEIDEPAAGEFARVLTEIRLGRDTDEALDALVLRVGSQDLEWAVTAIKIQRKIGGNLSEVLETVAKTVRERETLRRQVRVLSAEGRISIIVLTVLPILIAGYIMVVNPEYLRTLTSTAPGIAMSIGGGLLMGLGYLWMRKIVRLDV